MSLDPDDVRYVASLARLALDEDEVERLAPQLGRILAYAEQVSEVATDDVPPTAHPYPLRDVLRPDDPQPSIDREELLAAAPAVEDERFAVPRIVAEDA